MAPILVKHIKSQRHYLLVEVGRFTEKDNPQMVVYYPLYECEHHDAHRPWVRLLKDHESAYEVSRRNGGPRFCEVKPKDLSTQEREVLHKLLLKLEADLDWAKTFYLEPEVILTEYIPVNRQDKDIPPIGLQAEDIIPYQQFLEGKGYLISKMDKETLYIWNKMKGRSSWERKYIIQADALEVRRLITINFNRPQIYQRKLYYMPIYHSGHIESEHRPHPRRYEEIERKGCHDDIHVRGRGHKKQHQHPEHWERSEVDFRHRDPHIMSEHRHSHLFIDQELNNYDHEGDAMGHHANRDSYSQEQMPWE